MDDSQKYEEDCKAIRKVNKGLLNEFERWLKASARSEKTIKNHLSLRGFPLFIRSVVPYQLKIDGFFIDDYAILFLEVENESNS